MNSLRAFHYINAHSFYDNPINPIISSLTNASWDPRNCMLRVWATFCSPAMPSYMELDAPCIVQHSCCLAIIGNPPCCPKLPISSETKFCKACMACTYWNGIHWPTLFKLGKPNNLPCNPLHMFPKPICIWLLKLGILAFRRCMLMILLGILASLSSEYFWGTTLEIIALTLVGFGGLAFANLPIETPLYFGQSLVASQCSS